MCCCQMPVRETAGAMGPCSIPGCGTLTYGRLCLRHELTES